MRLFVAVEIAAAVADALVVCSDELRRRAARAPRARITWVKPEQLHVTVRFIGEVDEGNARDVAASLAPDMPVPPFELTVQGAGAFPERGAPRVLWAGIAQGLDSLQMVEAEVSARLDRCGIPREARPYHPHVTLARVREPGGLRTAEWIEGWTDRGFGVSPVNAITLFESRPSKAGHVYRSVQRTPLGRGQTLVTSRSGV